MNWKKSMGVVQAIVKERILLELVVAAVLLFLQDAVDNYLLRSRAAPLAPSTRL